MPSLQPKAKNAGAVNPNNARARASAVYDNICGQPKPITTIKRIQTVSVASEIILATAFCTSSAAMPCHLSLAP
jgi:hypothetical protein